LAAQVKDPFSKLFFVEKDQEKCDALAERIKQFPQPNNPEIFCGDANTEVNRIVDLIPKSGCLILSFLDPYGLHLHYETLQSLSQIRSDLIIFFPDHVDALRNWNAYYMKENSNLTKVLGTKQWMDELRKAIPSNYAQILYDIYTEQISKLGYEHIDFARIAKTDGRFLYKLIFCSKHQKGLDFWHEAANNKLLF